VDDREILFRFPTSDKYFSVLPNLQRLRDRPRFLSNGILGSFPGIKQSEREVGRATHLHPVLILRVTGAIPLLHQYVSMLWTGKTLPLFRMDMIRWQYITNSSDIALVKASSISAHDILGTVDDARSDDVRVLLYFLA
jgi:hypothetical protein